MRGRGILQEDVTRSGISGNLLRSRTGHVNMDTTHACCLADYTHGRLDFRLMGVRSGLQRSKTEDKRSQPQLLEDHTQTLLSIVISLAPPRES